METKKSNAAASTRTDVRLLECFGLAPTNRVKNALGPLGQLTIQTQKKRCLGLCLFPGTERSERAWSARGQVKAKKISQTKKYGEVRKEQISLK